MRAIGLGLLTAVDMKSSIFRDVLNCNLTKVNTYLGSNASIFRVDEQVT
jgi:hypothetical protein